MSVIPPAALAAATEAVFTYRHGRPALAQTVREMVTVALNAAAPHIAAAERERIQQLALDRNARYIPGCGPDCRGGHQVTAPFAEMLTEPQP